MDPQLDERLKALELKIDAVYKSSEKTRKYFLSVLIVSVVAFVLPLIGLVFAIPKFFTLYSSLGSM